MERSHYLMPVGKETGWCHSASDDKTEVPSNCELKGSGHRRAQEQVLAGPEQNAK